MPADHNHLFDIHPIMQVSSAYLSMVTLLHSETRRLVYMENNRGLSMARLASYVTAAATLQLR